MVTNYRTMQEIVYDTIRESILSGRYMPGHHLIAEDLAKDMGVSRMPIREALHRLEMAGLVKILPHRGAVVSQLSEPEIIEIYHMRAVLEGLAARLAVPHIQSEDIEQLYARLDGMQRALQSHDMDALVRINREFHLVIWRAARAPRLLELCENLYDASQRFRNLSVMIAGRAEEIIQEHRRIVTALERHDAVAAERNANEHYEITARGLLNTIDHQTPER